MFTGIIEEIGKITNILPIAGGKKIKISARKIMDDIKINDSVCINGVCLTVVKKENDSFWVDAVGATLEKSTFPDAHVSNAVNLERALKLSDRLGGHFVQGHVNAMGVIKEIKKLGENYFLKIDLTEEIEKYLIPEGSIAVDGISLTIAEVEDSEIGISIIPHTWQNTNLKERKIGDRVNIETDVIAKYVEKMTTKNYSTDKNKITENWLKERGY
jgi:riboflavin synthase